MVLTQIETEKEYNKALEGVCFFKVTFWLLHNTEGTKEIAKLISTDAGMTAKILITDIQQACDVIELKNLRNFLFVLYTNNYLAIENPKLSKKAFIRAIITKKIANLYSPITKHHRRFHSQESSFKLYTKQSHSA